MPYRVPFGERILFVGDLHAKPRLLDHVSHVADGCRADGLIMLGDVMDDWHATDLVLLDWVDMFLEWVDMQRRSRHVTVLTGNHDVPYWTQPGSRELDRIVRYGTPGYHPLIQARVFRRLDSRLGPRRLAWTRPGCPVVASHAGVTRGWLRERRIPRDQWTDPMEVALALGDPEYCYLHAGTMRGGSGVPSPLWADRRELEADPVPGLIQIVGHTPVPTVTRSGGLWFTDTMSIMRSGLPIGDGSMLLMTQPRGQEPRFTIVGASEDRRPLE